MNLPIFQTSDKNLSLMQTKWASILNPVINAATPSFGPYVPTLSGFGTVVNLSAFYFQIGKIIFVTASWVNGTIGATNVPNISLPNNAQIDFSSLSISPATGYTQNAGTGNTFLGFGAQGPTSGGSDTPSEYLFVYPNSNQPTSLAITYEFTGHNQGQNPIFSNSNNFTAGSQVVLFFMCPIL